MPRPKKAAVPASPQAKLAAAIKSARDAMRKDAGLNGDIDRIPQLAWLLFLKAFDGLDGTARSLTVSSAQPSRLPTAGATGPPIRNGVDGGAAARLRQRQASAVPARAYRHERARSARRARRGIQGDEQPHALGLSAPRRREQG